MSQNVLTAALGEGFEKRLTVKEKLLNELFHEIETLSNPAQGNGKSLTGKTRRHIYRILNSEDSQSTIVKKLKELAIDWCR